MAFPDILNLSDDFGTTSAAQYVKRSYGDYISVTTTLDEPLELALASNLRKDGVTDLLVKLTRSRNIPLGTYQPNFQSKLPDNELAVWLKVVGRFGTAANGHFTSTEARTMISNLRSFLNTSLLTDQFLRGER